MSGADLNVTKSIMIEVEQLYSRDDDLKDIQDIQKMSKEIDQFYAANLKDAKEIIKMLAGKVSAKEAEIAAPSESEHIFNLQKIAAEKENVEQCINNLLHTVEHKRDNITKIASSSLALKDQSDQFANDKQLNDSRTAYAVSLYTTVSGIEWDYAAPSHELAGYVANEAKKEFQQFRLDTRTMSAYETANALWESIGAAVA